MRPFRSRGLSRLIPLGVATLLAGVGLCVAGSTPAYAASCADVQAVFARGTFEPGTFGAIVGDPVFAALQARMNGRSLSGYAVRYPADLSAGSPSAGNADLVSHVAGEAAACPGERFILVGYSQGANVVDNSIGVSSAGALVGGPIVATIPSSVAPRVAAVLLFGNPIRALGRSVTGTYAARTLDLCATGDPVCQPGGLNTLAHLSYGQNAGQAAGFAVARL